MISFDEVSSLAVWMLGWGLFELAGACCSILLEIVMLEEPVMAVRVIWQVPLKEVTCDSQIIHNK